MKATLPDGTVLEGAAEEIATVLADRGAPRIQYVYVTSRCNCEMFQPYGPVQPAFGPHSNACAGAAAFGPVWVGRIRPSLNAAVAGAAVS